MFRPVFSLGDNTFPVPMSLFANNRKRLCESLRKNGNVPKGAVAVLQGGSEIGQDSTDVDLVFRQVIIVLL